MTERSLFDDRSSTGLVGDRLSEKLEEARVAIKADLRRECNRVIFGMIPTYLALLGLVVTITKLS